MPPVSFQRHIFMIMDLATGGELFNLVTKNPGDCATEAQIKRMLTNMLSAVRMKSFCPVLCAFRWPRMDLGQTALPCFVFVRFFCYCVLFFSFSFLFLLLSSCFSLGV